MHFDDQHQYQHTIGYSTYCSFYAICVQYLFAKTIAMCACVCWARLAGEYSRSSATRPWTSCGLIAAVLLYECVRKHGPRDRTNQQKSEMARVKQQQEDEEDEGVNRCHANLAFVLRSTIFS